MWLSCFRAEWTVPCSLSCYTSKCPFGFTCHSSFELTVRCLPTDEPVDLVNVAFAPSGSTTFQTPDRLSGIEAYEELKLACSRDWRLVTVDVSFNVSTSPLYPVTRIRLGLREKECQDHRQRVLDLMYPAATGKLRRTIHLHPLTFTEMDLVIEALEAIGYCH